MRARMLLLVLAAVLVGGFAWQNWAEINRPTTLVLGVVTTQAPLGLILLTLLGLTLLWFLVSAATMQTTSLMEGRQHARELHTQRELADRAEASRFTELRQMLTDHLAATRQRDTQAHTEVERALAQQQRDTRALIEQMNLQFAARLDELDHRLDSRLASMGGSALQPLDDSQRSLSEPPRLRDEPYPETLARHERV